MKNAFQIKIIDGVKCLIPFCEKAVENLADFQANQVVTTGKVSGTTKVRSLKENNLYFSSCKTFRELMMPDPRWQYANVDHWFRYHCGHIDQKKAMVMPDGVVHFPVLPLNFAGCKQALANGYYNNAFEAKAGFVGVDKETYINEVKARMTTR